MPEQGHASLGVPRECDFCQSPLPRLWLGAFIWQTQLFIRQFNENFLDHLEYLERSLAAGGKMNEHNYLAKLWQYLVSQSL